MNELLGKLKIFVDKLNSKGIPFPMVRDPATGKSSVSLTLLFISSLHVQLALVNKFAKFFDGMDTDNSLEFFMICAGLYFGRTLSKKVQPEQKAKDE
jgi:hypothetical protein